jgi:hypothetical protein
MHGCMIAGGGEKGSWLGKDDTSSLWIWCRQVCVRRVCEKNPQGFYGPYRVELCRQTALWIQNVRFPRSSIDEGIVTDSLHKDKNVDTASV